jgi:dTDP-L-rhamnose 4-epimerase
VRRPAPNPDAELVAGDVRNPGARRALRGVDAVCHHAAMVGLGVVSAT